MTQTLSCLLLLWSIGTNQNQKCVKYTFQNNVIYANICNSPRPPVKMRPRAQALVYDKDGIG